MKLVSVDGSSVNKAVKCVKVGVGVDVCDILGLGVVIGVGYVIDSSAWITFVIDYLSDLGYSGGFFGGSNEVKLVGYFIDKSFE